MKKDGLSQKAYVPIAEGDSYDPFVSARESLPEFTIKAVGLGILFGIIFGAANAYLGLRAGLTISTSIPVAVMTVAVFRALSGVGIQRLPALFMWGVPPELLQMTLLAMCGGLLGILFMIPLRRFLIEKEHGKLPYPEGTACAEVLVANEIGGGRARFVFYGLAGGALFKLLTSWLRV
ncbi:MAG: OPT/YSL family transporter, partial [Planctomycetota bacterium]